MKDIKQAACIFIKNMPKSFKIAIVSFGSDVDIDQDFTDNKHLLQKRIWKIRPYGGTSLYDALYMSSELLLQNGNQIDVKTIICLTDGKDCNPAGNRPMSIRTVEKAIAKASHAQARVISIGLGSDIDAKILTKIGKATNGAYLPVLTPEKLAMIYQKLGQRLKLEKFLTINYTTPDSKLNGTIRNVLIKSNWQNYKNQGSGTYRAPLPPVSEKHIKEPSKKTTKFIHETLEAQYIEFHYIPMVREKYKILDKASLIRKYEYTNNRFADEISIIDKEPGKWELLSSEAHVDRRTTQPGGSPFTENELARGARVQSIEKFYIRGEVKNLTGVESEEQ